MKKKQKKKRKRRDVRMEDNKYKEKRITKKRKEIDPISHVR